MCSSDGWYTKPDGNLSLWYHWVAW